MSAVYETGEEPRHGDTIVYADKSNSHPEVDEEWIVYRIVSDMVKAKCDIDHDWKQAFYTNKMRLVKRKGGNRLSRHRQESKL